MKEDWIWNQLATSSINWLKVFVTRKRTNFVKKTRVFFFSTNELLSTEIINKCIKYNINEMNSIQHVLAVHSLSICIVSYFIVLGAFKG